ncbi:hypothetical protein A2U01_0086342 [Trifolium medium]|uniref:Uncharacterized protein n=1 Tax=Trifolium medium TaxID=97028 RepID=A0A392TWL0_9FABA|nr:hypothetical protein [Trifolium medium]
MQESMANMKCKLQAADAFVGSPQLHLTNGTVVSSTSPKDAHNQPANQDVSPWS